MLRYLAPMEGITSYILRNAIENCYGGIDKYFTPFITSASMNHRERADVATDNNVNIPLVPQILSSRADEFIDIAKSIGTRGYKQINLNLGCPSGTVVSKHRGAGFLALPDELDRFLSQIYMECDMDISIKTRIGMHDISEWRDIVEIYSRYPIQELIIHPRLQCEFYKGVPHMDEFVYAARRLQDCGTKISYNGNIVDLKSYIAVRDIVAANELDNVESVMLGRGMIALPMLARDIADIEANPDMNYTNHISYCVGDSGTLFAHNDSETDRFRMFHDEIIDVYMSIMSGDMPVLHKMKELWSYWSILFETLPDYKKLHKKLLKTRHMNDYMDVIGEINKCLGA